MLTLEEPEQNVRGDGAFVGLIQHDDRISSDIRINDTLSLQHTVRHELNLGLRACTILETDCIADLLTQPTTYFFRHSLCDRHGSNTTRLGTADLPVFRETRFCEVLNDLGGFSRPGVPDNDEDLMLRDSSVLFSANSNTQNTHFSDGVQ